MLLSHNVYNLPLLVVLTGCLLSILSTEDLVNLFIVQISPSVSNLLLEVLGCIPELSLSIMLLLLLIGLDSFMELLVLELLLLLFERSNLLLLLEEPGLDLTHVFIGL